MPELLADSSSFVLKFVFPRIKNEFVIHSVVTIKRSISFVFGSLIELNERQTIAFFVCLRIDAFLRKYVSTECGGQNFEPFS